jgi:two-component system, OmpR family, response regulator
MRILLVEDEPEMADTLRKVLEKERFIVDSAGDLATAEKTIDHDLHDLVILDRTLPDGDGLALMRKLRTGATHVPVIVLSARGSLADRVHGLDQGADDYLPKPFALEELLARIRALRRRPQQVRANEIHAGRLVFGVDDEEVSVGGVRLELPRRELRVLAALLRRLGRTVIRESLEEAVYGFDDEIQSNSLDSHISRLRRKLADTDAGLEIHSIRGVGYLLKITP